jgi:hypothetical protein
MSQFITGKSFRSSFFWVLAVFGCLGIAQQAIAETYGVKNPQGIFVPKVTITIDNKEILLKKLDPAQKFRSIAVKIQNRNIERNVGHLTVEWLNAEGDGGKPIPFAGPLYDNATKVFRDSMTRSAAMKIVEKTKRNLFEGKPLSDLFTISIDDEPLISAESASEKNRTVQLGTGRDVSISVDKKSIEFNESNLKKSEMLDVDNRSGLDQVVGVELPDKDLLFFQKVVRKPEQRQVPENEWERFSLAPGGGISIVLIPEPDPLLLSRLDGKEVVIKVYEGSRVRREFRVPIKVSSDLRSAARTTLSPGESSPEEGRTATRAENGTVRRQEGSPGPQAAARQEPSSGQQRVQRNSGNGWGGVLLWGLQITNLILLLCLAVYGIFFMLPKMQVLEDRLAKNEMFIHGTREAIREELDQIKEEIVNRCEEVCQDDTLPE